MTFRIEEKIILQNNDKVNLKKWLIKNEYRKLYPKRKIHSLYFDNYNRDIYSDSEEGCIPRKKIRIRNYPNIEVSQKNLEIKTSAVEGRFKISKKINNSIYKKFLNFGYFDKYYGICKPIRLVEYEREYLSNNFFRITIDSNINYSLFNSKIKFKDNFDVMEFKSDNLNLKSWILENTYFAKSRFSKYCRSYYFIN